jgi:two-component system OmpR family sensor kinase
MVSRRLRWAAIIILLFGIQAALVARLALPSEAGLYWTFTSDPATLILLGFIGLAACLFMTQAVVQWLERKQGELEVELTNKHEAERRRFIQRLDHELKNPLTAIQIQLDNLQDSADTVSTLEDVRDQANRLVNLTRGLRRLADLETRPLELETFEIGELLQEVVELLQSSARIQLDVQKVPWPIPPIKGDRELLLLAVRNVVANALSYSSGEVQIRARHTTGSLILEVLDTGRGIPDEDLVHVTEELYRGANVHDMPGSGLGLSIVERIIERHHGRLEIMSRPEQGTIVSLVVPYNDDLAH